MCVARSAAQLIETGFEYSVADLGTIDGCARAVSDAEARLGPIDILIVNHGIGSAHERVIWEQNPEDWVRTLRVNLDGPFHLARLVMKGMVERRYGRIVFTSSTAGLVAEHAGQDLRAVRGRRGFMGLIQV